MFFNDWGNIGRTIIIGILAYICLVITLRVSGKRTLSKMNAFDLVVTMALGSTLATILLSQKVALAEGVTAFIVLIGMQYIVAWLSVRSKTVKKLSKSSPSLLWYNGDFCHDQMKKERIVEAEINQAVREAGHSSIEEVQAVILETNGTLSVLQTFDK